MSSKQLPREPRQDRLFAEQHEEWTAQLRRQVVSRRTVGLLRAVGAAAGQPPLQRLVAARPSPATATPGPWLVKLSSMAATSSFGEYRPGRCGQVQRHIRSTTPCRRGRSGSGSTDGWTASTAYGRGRSAAADSRPGAERKAWVLVVSCNVNADQFFVHATGRAAPWAPSTTTSDARPATRSGTDRDATFLTAPCAGARADPPSPRPARPAATGSAGWAAVGRSLAGF